MSKRLAVLAIVAITAHIPAFERTAFGQNVNNVADVSTQDAPHTGCDTYASSDQDAQQKGTGIPFDRINPALAVPACEAAVRQYPNSNRLTYQLGRSYQKANKVALAFHEYRKAAGQGYAPAESNLAVMYLNGLGIAKDFGQALIWFQKAADQHLPAAQSNLGVMYQNGWGVASDLKRAHALFRQSADQGFAAAEYNLGTLYESGQGVPQDHTQALAWYGKAADKGFALAQAKLAQLSPAPPSGDGREIVGPEPNVVSPRSAEKGQTPTSQPERNELVERVVLGPNEQSALYASLADLAKQVGRVQADHDLTSFQRQAELDTLKKPHANLSVQVNTEVKDWQCTVVDVGSQLYVPSILSSGGLPLDPPGRRLIKCAYNGVALQLWLRPDDSQLANIHRRQQIRFDGRTFCLNAAYHSCEGFPTDFDARNVRLDQINAISTVKRDPDDAVAQVLNYTVFGKDEGFGDNFWSKNAGSKCSYRLQIATNPASENDDAVGKLEMMNELIGLGAALQQRRLIDLDAIDPKNIAFRLDNDQSLWGENGSGTLVLNAGNVLFYFIGQLDVGRLQRGWEMIYNKYCSGAHNPF